MGAIVKLTDQPAADESSSQQRIWRERPLSETWLFRGHDDTGRRGWFLRFSVTGLYPRRVGPFPSKAQALEVLEEVIAEIELGPLCDLMNAMTARQAYLVEGVPTLRGRRT